MKSCINKPYWTPDEERRPDTKEWNRTKLACSIENDLTRDILVQEHRPSNSGQAKTARHPSYKPNAMPSSNEGESRKIKKDK
jgi:hypothetical protein